LVTQVRVERHLVQEREEDLLRFGVAPGGQVRQGAIALRSEVLRGQAAIS
jgi:hypothetical protein